MNKTQLTIIALLEGAGYNDAAEYVADEYVSSKLAGDKWQTIETAPKDGTKFNGYSPIGGVRRNVMWGIERRDFDVNGFSGLERGYTHWMPQEPNPTPPSAPEVSDNEQPTDTERAEALGGLRFLASYIECLKEQFYMEIINQHGDEAMSKEYLGIGEGVQCYIDSIQKTLTRPQIDFDSLRRSDTFTCGVTGKKYLTLEAVGCNNVLDDIKKLMEGE